MEFRDPDVMKYYDIKKTDVQVVDLLDAATLQKEVIYFDLLISTMIFLIILTK